MFSPYYRRARTRRATGADPADPADHCAMNLALYGRGCRRWTMTERGRGALERDDTHLRIGPSQLRWTGDTLHADIDELSVPWPRRVRGTLTLQPLAWHGLDFDLDDAALHRWLPYAPCARVEVAFTQPRLRWSGHAYFDGNAGDAPLESGFARWHWSRARDAHGATRVLYEARRRDGSDRLLSLAFTPDGDCREMPAPPSQALSRTGWRIARATRADAPGARVVRTLEDTPFYARSELATHVDGRPAAAVHESLDLNRFTATTTQLMLPFRMPRRAG